MTTTTDHELNAQARKAIDAKCGEYDLVVFLPKPGEWGWHIRLHGPGDRDNDEWSPATSIKDAMGLLFVARKAGLSFTIYSSFVQVADLNNRDFMRRKYGSASYTTEDELSRAITEAFLAGVAFKG